MASDTAKDIENNTTILEDTRCCNASKQKKPPNKRDPVP